MENNRESCEKEWHSGNDAQFLRNFHIFSLSRGGQGTNPADSLDFGVRCLGLIKSDTRDAFNLISATVHPSIRQSLPFNQPRPSILHAGKRFPFFDF